MNSTKMLKLNQLILFNNNFLSRCLMPTTLNKIINSTTAINAISQRYSSDYLSAYVQMPQSYAFGRGPNNIIYNTIGELLEKRINRDNGKSMFISHTENIKKTATEFFNDVDRLAYTMHHSLGIKRGDVVGLWSLNNYDWIIIQYACARIGAILCTINPFYQKRELNFALRKGEIKTLFMPGKQSKQEIVNGFTKILIDALQLKTEDNLKFYLESIVTLDGECFVDSDIKTDLKISNYDINKLRMNTGRLESTITNAVLPDDPALIMFTSGTTGKPKGACLSHFSLVNNVHFGSEKFNMIESDNLCSPLPFFHAFAGVLGNLMILVCDASLLLPFTAYDIKTLVEAMNTHKSTLIYLVPTLAIDLLTFARKNNLQIPTLRGAMAGGASVPVETIHQFLKVFPSCTDFRIGYGSTESGPCATACRKEFSLQERTETVGAPLDFIEVKLIDPKTKQMVNIGQTGEIHTRGHNVMLGYWRDPEKTKEVIDEAGWYNTGDLGTMDEKGMLKIVGRTKELIIVGGENVYPREIEEILYTHQAVEIASVIGVPDERKGEAICAWIKLRQGQTWSEDEVKRFLQDQITYFKVPKYVLFVDGFPMTPTGKPQKFIMRDMTIKKLNLKGK